MTHRGDLIMDLIARAELARTEQAIQRQEEIIIIHASTLSARRVRTAMVPAERVKVFDSRRTLLVNVRDLGPQLHRCYPVSRDGSLETVEGSIRLRDLLADHLLSTNGGAVDWTPQIQPLFEIEGTASLTSLLTGFLERKDTVALVKREGENIGWITFDDVTEILMGARD